MAAALQFLPQRCTPHPGFAGPRTAAKPSAAASRLTGVKGSDGLTRRRRIGPLGIAIGLAILPAVAVSATVAVKHLRAPRLSSGAPSQLSPIPTPSPTPLPTPHQPLTSTIPPGMDVVYWARWDGTDASMYRLHAADTAGRDLGYIDVPPSSGHSPQPQPSPDGRMLLLDSDVYASDGQWLATLRTGDGGTVWADDSRHLCHLSPGSAGRVAAGVDLLALDGRVIGGAQYPLTDGESGPVRPRLASCSATRGRANIELPSGSTTLQTRLVQLNLLTGKVESEKTLCSGADCRPEYVLSPDGRYLAALDANQHPVVEDLTTGRTTRLALASFPLGFSGDGSRLLVEVANPPPTSMNAKVRGLRVVDWRSGAVLWARSNADTMRYWVFSPPGAAIAVAACEHGGGTGAFPSGPCRLDLLDFSDPSGIRALEVGDGLTTAFGWNFN
jgi:hypothetical protein